MVYRALDGVADRAVLEARRDLLLCLLRDQQVLVAVYPRFLALSLAFRSRTGDGSPLKTLVFATSAAEGLAQLAQAPGPFHLLVSEHLADGPGLDLIRAAKARSTGRQSLGAGRWPSCRARKNRSDGGDHSYADSGQPSRWATPHPE